MPFVYCQDRDFDDENLPRYRPFKSGHRHLVSQLVEELESALGILSDLTQLNGYATEKLSEVLDDFTRSYNGQDYATGVMQGGMRHHDGAIPGQPQCFDMMDLSVVLLRDARELNFWRGLGSTLGALRRLGSPSSAMAQELIGEANDLIEALDELRRYPFLESALDQLDCATSGNQGPPSAEWDGCNPSLFHALSPLDENLRSSLRGLSAPELRLLFDDQRLVFFGQEYTFRRWKGEIGCLWVLAKNANKYVKREAIVSESGLKGDPKNLEDYIWRLRKHILRPAIETYYSRLALDPPAEEVKSCFITSPLHVRREPPGPYKLKLRPDQVRVSLLKPPWINKQRDGN